MSPFKAAGFGELGAAYSDSTLFPFDGLLCLGNSLPHLLSDADLNNSLQDFAACLRPGGMLLIQNRNFDAVLASRERWMAPQSHREGDTEWIFLRFYDYLPDGLIQFNVMTLQRSANADWQQEISSTTPAACAASGFAPGTAQRRFQECDLLRGYDRGSIQPGEQRQSDHHCPPERLVRDL